MRAHDQGAPKIPLRMSCEANSQTTIETSQPILAAPACSALAAARRELTCVSKRQLLVEIEHGGDGAGAALSALWNQIDRWMNEGGAEGAPIPSSEGRTYPKEYETMLTAQEMPAAAETVRVRERRRIEVRLLADGRDELSTAIDQERTAGIAIVQESLQQPVDRSEIVLGERPARSTYGHGSRGWAEASQASWRSTRSRSRRARRRKSARCSQRM